MTLEEYLDKVSTFADNDYGRMVRDQFADISGASELAMLACPNREELEQFRRAVAIMTPGEKTGVAKLTDEQIQGIADDARVDAGTLAIFLNGYVLACKRVS